MDRPDRLTSPGMFDTSCRRILSRRPLSKTISISKAFVQVNVAELADLRARWLRFSKCLLFGKRKVTLEVSPVGERMRSKRPPGTFSEAIETSASSSLYSFRLIYLILISNIFFKFLIFLLFVFFLSRDYKQEEHF